MATILLIISLVGYYYNSGMNDRFKPYALIKKVDNVILDRYLGFSIFEIDDYLKIKLTSFKFVFIKNKFENVGIEIDQKNLYNLELQRSNRMSGGQEKGNFSKAKLIANKKNMKLS